MYLGFFFVHWSKTETTQVWQSKPVNLDQCPFCKQESTIIYKIYNIKEKHYSSFSIGQGSFIASFVCRNCTTEGSLEKSFSKKLILEYTISQEYLTIQELHSTNPDKAKQKLDKLLRKSIKHDIPCEYIKNTHVEWFKV